MLLGNPGFAGEKTGDLIEKIQAVGKKGSGNKKAGEAWLVLSQQGPDALIPILRGLKKANPVAANYLRAAYETIVDTTVSQKKQLPAKDLLMFVKDTKQNGRARRLAYETLVKLNPDLPQKLLPKMLNDPGAELRRDAVEVILNKAKEALEKKKLIQARKVFARALKYARDRDQVQLAAEKLKDLGTNVNLVDHMGFITQWYLIGPFDSTNGIAFKKSYPPEKQVDLSANYEGARGKKVGWRKHTTENEIGEVKLSKLGLIDFNEIFGDLHDVCVYAYAEVESPKEQPVEIRAASNNAIKIYLNGKEVYAREEYHHGIRLDQHVGKGTLHKGKNEVLVKVIQNNQEETWAQSWSLQVRLSDYLGAKIPVEVVLNKKSN